MSAKCPWCRHPAPPPHLDPPELTCRHHNTPVFPSKVVQDFFDHSLTMAITNLASRTFAYLMNVNFASSHHQLTLFGVSEVSGQAAPPRGLVYALGDLSGGGRGARASDEADAGS